MNGIFNIFTDKTNYYNIYLYQKLTYIFDQITKLVYIIINVEFCNVFLTKCVYLSMLYFNRSLYNYFIHIQ